MTLRPMLRIALLLCAAAIFVAASPTVVLAVCGDGFLDGGEDCDDGNTTNGDCCSATCTAEAGIGNPSCCDTTSAPGSGLGGCNAGAACGNVCFTAGGVCNNGPACLCSVAACPVRAGEYRLVQTAGGTLSIAGLAPFAFPAGGTINVDIGPPNNTTDCLHPITVPPGGLVSPVFCIPTLTYTVQVNQAASPSDCGVGINDSNGGSDFTIVERADTSDTTGTCPLADQFGSCGFGTDSNMRVDITVGDGTVDTCGAGTLGQSITSIPIQSLTWIDNSGCGQAGNGVCDINGTCSISGAACGCVDSGNGTQGGPGVPCGPGEGTCGGGDVLVSVLNQILDFTTDTTTTLYADLDGDGCSLSGAGPAAAQSVTGACVNYPERTTTTAAAGPIASGNGPLFDNSFTNVLPNRIEALGPLAGYTCPGGQASVVTGSRCL